MKNVLNIIFFLVCLPLFSQEYGELGSTWYYKGYYSGTTSSYNEFLKVESIKDTTININTYHKLERQISKNTGIIERLEPVFIRNSNDTTYWYDTEYNKDRVFLVFNLKAGDTLNFSPIERLFPEDTITQLRISIVDTITISNQMVKRYRALPGTEEYFFSDAYFYDYIGGMSWFHPRPPETLDHSYGPLRCFTNSIIDTNRTNMPCEFLLSTQSNSNSEDIIKEKTISDIIHFNTSQQTLNYNLQIIDVHGKVYYSGPIKKQIDVSSYSKGIYLIHAVSPKNHFSIKITKI